jgi:hypothetical protein
MSEKHSSPFDGKAVLHAVLEASSPRPDQSSPIDAKIQYAVRFADSMAEQIARHLADRLPTIAATTKRRAASVTSSKQLDINFSTPQHGLALGISLKSVHVRDRASAERYTHNMKRNEEELRIEAHGYHKRQPYAVMVALLFLPFDSCADAKRDNPSSFGSWVRKLRPYSGRTGPKDEEDLFEKIYIGLYQTDGSDLQFFDVQDAPPKQGRPASLLSYDAFLDAVYHAYLKRNQAEFRWADGNEEPIEVEEAES